MLTKSHPLSRYKTNSCKNKKKVCLMHFNPNARVFVPRNWYKIKLREKFSPGKLSV